MDVLYEESSIGKNAAKEGKKYKVLHVFSWIFMVISILVVIIAIQPLMIAFSNAQPNENVTAEEIAQTIAGARGFLILLGLQLVFSLGMWFLFFSWKKKVNVSYDYTFVTGELRIAKVFNINKRKFLCKMESESILQIGDIDNASYDRLRADPSIKEVVFTPNYGEPTEGKFFMYILYAEQTGRKLYILECREELLVNILKFVKRGTLESDYVMQEKKHAK